MTRTIVVAGGGITGAFAAYFLADRGLQVTIVDAADHDCRASSNNPGGINPLHGPGIPGVMSEFALQCHLTHQLEWENISRLSGIEFNGRIISRMFVAFSDEDEARLRRAERLYEATDGFSAQWLEGPVLRERDPRINDEARGGLWTTGNGTVDPENYRRAVTKAACAKGAQVTVDRTHGVVVREGRVRELETESQSLKCDGVVFATGPWVEWLRHSFSAALPVRPVRGDLLLVELGNDAPTHDVTWNRYGIYHHGAGRFWLGGTWQETGFDDSHRPETEREILDGVSRIIPATARARVVRHSTGLRPVTSDGMPILGRVPGVDNAWLALGGGSKGMLLGSGMGKTVADMITGTTTGAEVSFLSPERFGAPTSLQTARRKTATDSG